MIKEHFKRSIVAAPPKPLAMIDPTAFLPVGNEIDIMALTAFTCRWPVDTKDGVRFCGSTSEGSYCSHHYSLSRGKGTMSERDAIRVGLKFAVKEDSDATG